MSMYKDRLLYQVEGLNDSAVVRLWVHQPMRSTFVRFMKPHPKLAALGYHSGIRLHHQSSSHLASSRTQDDSEAFH